MLLYVDDIIVTGKDAAVLINFIALTHREFVLKDLGCLNYFLGLEVTYTDNGLFLELLKRAELLEAKLALNPLSAGEVFHQYGDPFDDPIYFDLFLVSCNI